MGLVLFLICLAASSIGAVVGAGGGVIIKPVVDLLGLLPVSTVSFCSGCTVLCMSVSSLIRTRKSGVRLERKTSSILAVGAAIGGFAGQYIFDYIRAAYQNDHLLGCIQSVLLLLIMIVILFYVCKKDRFPSFHIKVLFPTFLIGLFLGMISAFLGIGGGPLNVAVLFLFFSMDAKTAAKNSIYIIIFSQLTSIATALVTHSVPEFTWPVLLCMIAGGVGGALLGAAITKRIDNKGVEKLLKLLILFVIVISVYNILKFTVLA